jgi:predicted O-methyltransferase YrrM
VDPWQAYKGYREHVTQEKLDAFYAETCERLAPYRCQIMRATSLEAADKIAPRSLDFVYIDANHAREHVEADLAAWVPKVRRGGIVAGHDYIRRKGQDHIFGVKQAVDAYVAATGVRLMALRGDRTPSWAFYKP